MKIPSYKYCIAYLLEFLGRDSNPHKSSVVYEGVAELMGLTEEDKALLLPSGYQAIYKNRIGWAQDATKRAGLSCAPSRGMWKITNSGLELLKKYSFKIPKEVENEIANTKRDIPLSEIDGVFESEIEAGVELESSPEERIDLGVKELNDKAVSDLLEKVGDITPQDFENLVLKVLHAMGYGTNMNDVQRVGKSHDEGIDGIISLDKLGLEKIYVQAKRWKNQVGSPEIQTFMGALQIKGANKGVLISSGHITQPAYDLAKQANGNLVLINGTRLANLMIEYGIGVQHRIIKIAKFDEDYFE